MNSTMSGWSTLRMTILAARRVLPPDLITPAKASKPFMKETGPDAVPPPPRKYFETTTLVATCDQVVGISTSCCSKTTSPFSLLIEASRVSHWTSSNGATPGRVKYRFQGSPFRLRFEALAGAAAVTLGRSVDVFGVDRAIVNLRGWGGERPTSYAVG